MKLILGMKALMGLIFLAAYVTQMDRSLLVRHSGAVA
jgi:hypothetical protein